MIHLVEKAGDRRTQVRAKALLVNQLISRDGLGLDVVNRRRRRAVAQFEKVRRAKRRPVQNLEHGLGKGIVNQGEPRVEGGIKAARAALAEAHAARARGERVAADPRLRFSDAADAWWRARVTIEVPREREDKQLPKMGELIAPEEFLEDTRDQGLKELEDFLRIPSISSQPECSEGRTWWSTEYPLLRCFRIAWFEISGA